MRHYFDYIVTSKLFSWRPLDCEARQRVTVGTAYLSFGVAIGIVVHTQRHAVAIASLMDVGRVNALHPVTVVIFKRPCVEKQPDVGHRVDVAVKVDVAVGEPVIATSAVIGNRTEPRHWGYWTWPVDNHIAETGDDAKLPHPAR